MLKRKNIIKTMFVSALIAAMPSAVFAASNFEVSDGTKATTEKSDLSNNTSASVVKTVDSDNNSISNKNSTSQSVLSISSTNVVNSTATDSKAESNQDDSDTYKVGWVKKSDGTYNLYDGLGDMVKSSWCKVGGKWYYLKEDGTMATDWVKVDGQWYYVGEWGNMHTGWVKVGGLWYYLNENGVMQRGWVLSHNSWYYLNEYGAMVTNTVIDGYTIGSDGVCQ